MCFVVLPGGIFEDVKVFEDWGGLFCLIAYKKERERSY